MWASVVYYWLLAIFTFSFHITPISTTPQFASVFKTGLNFVAKPGAWAWSSMNSQLTNYRLAEFVRCLNSSNYNIERKLIFQSENETSLYVELNKQWNSRKTKVYPVAIAIPKSTKDVGLVVGCGFSSSIKVVPNSGGQNYESISAGTNSTVVIDFRYMRKIDIEGEGDNVTVVIQPGATVGYINSYLWENGGYGLPMTNQLLVGMAGDAIGGGHGYFASLFGLTSDSIVELEIVGCTGDVHVVNSQKNLDLWWGLRGVGSGYIAVITSIRLKPFKASDLKLTFTTLRYPLDTFHDAWTSFQKFHQWAEVNEPSISRTMLITTDSYNIPMPWLLKGITVQVLRIETPTNKPSNSDEEFRKVLAEYFPPPGVETSTTNPNYFQFVTTTGYTPIDWPYVLDKMNSIGFRQQLIRGTLPTDLDLQTFTTFLNKTQVIERFFKAKSCFINRLLAQNETDEVAKWIKILPRYVTIQITTETGAIQNHTKTETSYVHRNSTFNFLVRYDGKARLSMSKSGMNWIDTFWSRMNFLDSGETYQNYADLDLADHYQRNFKRNLGKLIDAKRLWDPNDYFQTELSLPTRAVKG